MSSAIENVLKKIRDSKLVNDGQIIILGLSGGPDSLCLLDALIRISKNINLMIVPVHINHKLRKNADKEQKHIEEICEGYDIPIISIEANCRKIAKDEKISIEEAGRIIRYGFFHSVADDLYERWNNKEAISIAVAHNADDQSETVLFRIIRGTGIHGLSGMRPYRMDPVYPIIRPLLNITRDEIEAYIKEAGLVPNIDESNEDTEYTRNRIRLELIPKIEEEYNPRVKENLRNLAEMAYMDDDCMRGVAAELMEGSSEIFEEERSLQIVLKLDEILEMHPAIIRRIVGIVFEELGIDEWMSYSLVKETIDVMTSTNPSAEMMLPGGIRAYRRYGEMVFELKAIDEEDDESYEDKPSHRLVISLMNIEEYKKNKHKCHAAFDYDLFEKEHSGKTGNIVIRNRKSGDFIALKGGKRKKIQDLFVDEKINKSDRGKVELVTIGSEVLWIIPSEFMTREMCKIKGIFSQKYQISDTSRQVIFLEIV